MSALPAICGIGGTFELEGKTWHWTPLTINDLGAFEAELRQVLAERLDMIQPALKASDGARLKGEDRRAVFEVAAREHLRLQSVGPFRLIDEFRVPDADAILFRHCLKKSHPELTLDDVRGMVANQVVGRVYALMVAQAQAAFPTKKEWTNFAAGSDSTQEAAPTEATRETPIGV